MEGREISIYLGEIKLTPPQPVAWNFLTSGSVNFHAFNNRIHALSDSDVSFHFALRRYPSHKVPSVIPFQHVRTKQLLDIVVLMRFA